MYLDAVVVFGLVIVVLTCAIVIYLSFYAYKHIKADIESHPEGSGSNGKNL